MASESSRLERNFRLTVAYDGTPFKGWQRQPGKPTVQGVLEEKLSAVCGHPVSLLVAGRTDAGVHALGQTCSFHTTSRLGPARLGLVLNQVLPHALRVTRARVVPKNFHATYHAKAKLYRYVIRNRNDYAVFDRDWVYHLRRPLDLGKMRKAARHLVGRHDFTSFCGISGRDRNPVRDLKRIRIAKKGPNVLLEYYGVSFLHQMIRILTGTLVYVGLGKIDPGAIPGILAARDRKQAGPTLPPTGLFLVRVDYPTTFPPVKNKPREETAE